MNLISYIILFLNKNYSISNFHLLNFFLTLQLMNEGEVHAPYCELDPTDCVCLAYGRVNCAMISYFILSTSR